MDKKLLMMALLITTGLATHAQEKLTRYQVRNAITVRTPIMNDSINPKGEKHTAKALLQTPVVLDLANAPTQQKPPLPIQPVWSPSRKLIKTICFT